MELKNNQLFVRLFLILGLMMLVVPEQLAQEYIFDKLTTENGLAENYVNCIHQDSRGFMWIGTNDGLCRYDGYEFKIFQIDNSRSDWIQSNLIYSISEDKEGNLWIVTLDKGLYRYNLINNSFEHFNFSEDSIFLANDDILTTLRFRDEILVGSRRGLYIIPYGKDGEFPVSYPSLSYIADSNSIRSIIKQDEDKVWILSQEGLSRYSIDDEGARIMKSYLNAGLNNAMDIILYGDGILIATADGIFYFDENQGYQLVYDLSAIELLLDKENNLWVGNYDGLFVLRADPIGGRKFGVIKKIEEGWEAHNIGSSQITSLYEDRFGSIWIGTKIGINKYNPYRKKFAHYRRTANPGSISNNIIRSMFEDSGGNLWIGTEGGGINFLPRDMVDRKEYNNFIKLPVNQNGPRGAAYCIRQVDINMQSYCLVGTGSPLKLAFFKLENNLPVHVNTLPDFDQVPQTVFTIEDDSNYIWLGTFRGGLCRYDKQNGGLVTFRQTDDQSISSDVVRDLLVDSRGNLWVATGNGLNFLASAEKGSSDPVFREYIHHAGDTSSLAHNYVLTLFETSGGDIWVGTMGGGLNKYLGNNKFMTIDQEHGIPNNVIKGMLEDSEKNLWISTNRGLSRIDPLSFDINNFDLYDGLQEFEFGEHACVKLSDGEMLFGGVRGFNAFYPERITGETTLPELVFTDLQVQNRSISAGELINGKVILERVINETEKISLKYRENSFSIHFAGLHYSAPYKNQYKYILEGFDRDWIRTTARTTFAKYSNLKPGLYTFRLMASNNDGLWNPDPKVLIVRVIPPKWLTIPAFIIYLVLFLLLVQFFKRYSFIRTREKHELMLEHFEQEKIKELSQMKLRFYTNISHEFRTPLTLIISPLQTLIKTLEKLPKEKTLHMLNLMFRNADVLLRLVNQLMDFRKMEQDKMVLTARQENFYLTARGIYKSFEELALRKEIQYTFSTFSKEIMIWCDYEKIEKILNNLLSNAFKYTHKAGQVSLSIVDYNEDFIELRIEDTGVGISDESREHIFERFYTSKTLMDAEVGSTGIGLSLTKGLVELHKGIIDFESEPGSGSTFFVRLRKGDAHLSEKEKVQDDQSVVLRKEEYGVFPEQIQGEDFGASAFLKKGSKLLIVEDNFELRNYLQECFQPDFNVFTAEDGDRALEQIQWFEPDLIISDVMMRNMDGFELCREIKSNEATSHIPVILLSAKSTEEAQIKGYNLGADAYIPKPFNFEVLLAQVKGILKRREEIKDRFKKNLDFSPSEIAMTALDEKFLNRTLELVEENISYPGNSVNKLALDYGISQKLMNKKLKALTGLTTTSFIRSLKLKRAAQLLITGRYSVSEITYELGFSDLKYFRTCFKEEFNVTPSEYKKMNS